MLAQVKPRIPCSFPQSEPMLTDNSLSDGSDTDGYLDCDPEETIEDIPHRTRQPSSSQANLNRRSLPTYKMKKHRCRRKS
ncbi:hypothetical protein AVEN_6151-1 [Araneus ventricosus]|uniref:Uncharacterized protein n=1 Tax=Araneus ventricosus TaxID=182803 RepID=A0A4Y2T589_ARAVE|nr:hypothetical protein AVEN_6151-1 [Araneus ventricosus]